MLIDSEILPIKEWADNGTPSSQLLMFWFLAKGDRVGIDIPLGNNYLVNFLQNPPVECIEAIKDIDEVEPDTDFIFENDVMEWFSYLNYIALAGMHFLEDNNKKEAALWFKKALDLSEEHLRFKDDLVVLKFRRQLQAYLYWPDIKNYFDEDAYKAFYLGWERKLYCPSNIANQDT